MPPRLELENFGPQSNPSTQNLDSLSLYSELRNVMQANKQSEPPAENLPQITISQSDSPSKPALTTALREQEKLPMQNTDSTKEFDSPPICRSQDPEVYKKPEQKALKDKSAGLSPDAKEILEERESVARTLRKYMDQMDLPGFDSKVKDGVLSKEELMTFLFLSDKSKSLSDSERKDLMSALNQLGWIANAFADPNLPFQMTTISKGDIDHWLTQMPWQLTQQGKN